jgi:hypothetical protein
MQVHIVLVPDLVRLDATGPYEVLARIPGVAQRFRGCLA